MGRDLLIIIVSLAIAEISLRWWAPEYGHNVYDRDTTGSSPMAFNELGYRGSLPTISKKPGEIRILALGDSVTFGTGLSVADTWPSHLQNPNVSVINGGMPHTDLRQLRLAYEERWAVYSPDVVIVLVTGNMVSLGWIQRDNTVRLPHNGYLDEPAIKGWRVPVAYLRRAVSGLCISAVASIGTRVLLYATGVTSHNVIPSEPNGAIFAFGWQQGGLDPDQVEQAWRLTEPDLVVLANSVKQRGGKLVVAFAPPRFILTVERRDNVQFVPRERLTINAVDRFKAICDRQAISCADVLSSVRAARRTLEAGGHRAPMYILCDYVHFDRDGSAAIADAFKHLIAD